MVASNDTVRAIMQAILRHVDRETARNILADLADVPGNRSFRETIERMQQLLDEGF